MAETTSRGRELNTGGFNVKDATAKISQGVAKIRRELLDGQFHVLRRYLFTKKIPPTQGVVEARKLVSELTAVALGCTPVNSEIK